MISRSARDIKAEIMRTAPKSEIANKMRKVLTSRPSGKSDGEWIEEGNALEHLIKQPGWEYIEQFIIRKADIIGMVTNSALNTDMQKGIANGLIELEQYIDTAIRIKNEMIEKEKPKYETETVPKD